MLKVRNKHIFSGTVYVNTYSFVFIPLIGALVISVMNIDIYMNNISFAGFGNYLKMFHDSRIGNATFNSFYFALAEVPLQVFMALLMLMLMIKIIVFISF